MATLPEPLTELLAWKQARDQECFLRKKAALLATGVRAPPPPVTDPVCRQEAGTVRDPLPTSTPSHRWKYVASAEDLLDTLDALADAEVLAIDTETTGLKPLTDSVRLLQLAAPSGPAYVVDLFRIPKADRAGLAEILAGPIPKTIQNATFDMAFLARAGLPVGGPVFDTMLAAQLLDAGLGREANLAAIAKTYLKRPLSKEHQASDWSAATLSPEQLEYAAHDALVLVELRPILIERLKAAKLVEVAKLEFKCLPAIVELEASGLLIDRGRWEMMTTRLEADLKDAEEQARACLPPGINLNSHGQILSALRGLGRDVTNTREETLAPIAEKDEVVRAVLRYRKAFKLLSAFGKKYPTYIHPLTGRIHAQYRQIGAATGRMSCREPNLQQVPHDPAIRSCFIAAPGCRMVIADFSQIELRVMAQLSQDARMLEAYRTGEDLHRLTASLISRTPLTEVTKEQRQAAKAVNFGLIFGMGANGLQAYAKSQYGVALSLKKARTFKKTFFEAYPGVAAWHDRMKGQRETRTLSGRLRRWTGDQPKITEVLNAPVQGTAADILKLALANLLPRLEPLGGRIVAVVHDEILVEVPADRAEKTARIVQETMEAAGTRYLPDVPVIVEAKIARDWSEK